MYSKSTSAILALHCSNHLYSGREKWVTMVSKASPNAVWRVHNNITRMNQVRVPPPLTQILHPWNSGFSHHRNIWTHISINISVYMHVLLHHVKFLYCCTYYVSNGFWFWVLPSWVGSTTHTLDSTGRWTLRQSSQAVTSRRCSTSTAFTYKKRLPARHGCNFNWSSWSAAGGRRNTPAGSTYRKEEAWSLVVL